MRFRFKADLRFEAKNAADAKIQLFNFFRRGIGSDNFSSPFEGDVELMPDESETVDVTDHSEEQKL